ncbi:MAG: hypothetical protein KF708_13895 [Pirellulales bacterium]|nr:hypothetical protein [Pirellulales bacterium]
MHPVTLPAQPATAEPTLLPAWSPSRWMGIAAALYALLTVLMFGHVLWTASRMPSAEWCSDIRTQFYHVRTFGFGELASGNLALWNPHVFSGTPYAANFQSALFYPPNWLFLVLPTALAINWSIALHAFLIGCFTFYWLFGRKLHPLACLMGGGLLIFCGPYFAPVYAGNLSNLCTMVWAPLILRAIDDLLGDAALRGGLLGSVAVAMQILAGHPQYVYYTAIAAGLYFVLSLVTAERRLTSLAGYLGMYFGGAALAAVQLVPGLASADQSVRSGGVPYEFAIHYSLSWENFVTFIAPGFFGEMELASYWGRGMLWEMTGFFGVTGLLLAVYGVCFGTRQSGRFVLAALVPLMLLLALGGHTPLFRVLYDYAPGFNSFRGNAKFLFPAVLFAVALAATGLDTLLRQPRATPYFAGAIFALAVACWIAGGAVAASAERGSDGWWAESLLSLRDQAKQWRELYHVTPEDYDKPDFIRHTGVVAGASLQRAGTMCIIVALFLLGCAWEPRTAAVLAALAVVEVLVFAWPLSTSFPASSVTSENLRKFLASQPGDFRIIDQQNPNEAMTIGAYDVLGYDPGVTRRYAEIFTYAAHTPLEETSQYLRWHPKSRIPSLYRLARGRFLLAIVESKQGATLQSIPLPNPLPRLLLVGDYQVAATRDDVFRAMSQADFSPEQTVILEREPEPRPAAEGNSPVPGRIRVLDSSTDHLTVEAELASAAILLITDAYDSDWQVTPLEGSVQQHYELMPADWAFRAIPLAAGKHHFRLEYRPAAIKQGAVLTLLASAAWLGLMVWNVRRRWKAKPSHPVA